MMLKSVFLGTAAALILNSAYADDTCKTSNPAKTIKTGVLTVAAYAYPPFTIPDGNEIKGIEGAIINRFAKENCLTVSTVIVAPSATIQYVLSGKADVSMGDWTRTAEREKVLGLSAPTLLDKMAIYSKSGFSSLDDLKGKSIGLRNGDMVVSDFQKIDGIDVKLYSSQSSLVQDLENGRIDAIFDGYSVGKYSQSHTDAYKGVKIVISDADKRVRATTTPLQTAVLYNKGNSSLGSKLDEAIGRMHEDGFIKAQLEQYGLDGSLAEVGAPSLVQ